VNSTALSHIARLRSDPHPIPDYAVCHTPDSLYNYFYGDYWGNSSTTSQTLLATDTESLPNGECYCVTISLQPGTGRLIYAHDRPTINALAELIPANDLLIFHNYLHDIHPFADLSLPIYEFRDTMVMAYLYCLGGGGSEDESGMAGRGSLSLKSLAYRFCNMKMTSFRDTVYPHSVPKLTTYLHSVINSIPTGDALPTCECRHPRDSHNSRGKTGKLKGTCTQCPCPRYKLHTMKKDHEDKLLGLLARKSNNLLTSISEVREWDFDDEEMEAEKEETDYTYTDLDPFRRIKQWHPHDREYMVGLAGSIPVASVADVPELELKYYACRDADATLRFYNFLMAYEPWLFY